MTVDRTPFFALVTAGVVAVGLLAPRPAPAQSLRGSRASIDRMYRTARAERLAFYETAAGVRRAVRSRRLVRLTSDSSVVLHRIAYPFVRPATRTFVARLAQQYLAECEAPLVVTSATRPATRQPANSTARSVHPTGMAVDLRKPQTPACLRWLRATLLDLEDAGLLEATEERSPAHFHVAVYPTRYSRYVASRVKAEPGAVGSRTVYTVREGDTLWDIAHEHHTTVDALTSANSLRGETIQPGEELAIPQGG